MLEISRIRIENQSSPLITDAKKPRFSFSLSSDQPDCFLQTYRITVSDQNRTVFDSGIRDDQKQISILYEGEELNPFTRYKVHLEALDNHDESAEKDSFFSTGRMELPWSGKWITDLNIEIPEKSSPSPLLFRKKFTLAQKPVRAWMCITALGIHDAKVNGQRLSDTYFAPGFTSYHHQLQYQTYPINCLNEGENEINIRIGAGWAVGAFTFNRHNRTYADTPSLLCEVHMEMADGHTEIIGSDETWQVSSDGKVRFADFYDGEVVDSRINEDEISYRQADLLRKIPETKIIAEYGAPVKVMKVLEPVRVFSSPNGERIYDFGQNFAGVIHAEINGKEGQEIIIRHAEVLMNDELFVKPLRTAKAEIRYTCKEGHQTYSPRMTYMGFCYAGVRGIGEKQLKLKAYVLSSDMEETGSFECSDKRLNQLQHNIVWGGRSNFVDIPTDCPQRDERMGWTGDIAVFAKTACFNFDMSRFLEKWLKDLASEQTDTGELPVTVPKAEDGWKKRVTGCWGDACILVPYAEYMARGDEELLKRQYPSMKRFLEACEKRAALFSTGKHRYIWSLPFQFGDWCAPDEDFMRWILKGPWVATAYFANSCHLFSEIAKILGRSADQKYYSDLYEKISDAYVSVFCKADGKLKNEFQTAYVLPLAFSLVHGEKETVMVRQLEEMVKKAEYAPHTGFPGTPYLLFALSDHGKADTAFRTLFNDEKPGWLYALKAGATTIWERWDALKPDGAVNFGKREDDGGMVSFNHYANGAVGDFLYRRIAGVEPIEGGYRRFRISPLTDIRLTYAKAAIHTPYGLIVSSWKKEEDELILNITVPVSTRCIIALSDGTEKTYTSGTHVIHAPLRKESACPSSHS